ncbi:flavodoxin [Pseudoalteromonas sp. A25]|uniref:flavodoxin family protein n=1 Tax=Pseudoalteromonas sp. A25 TaxID=116092 RepID=UPI001260E808|nr:flavodoxin family protein [Pseudoalteromonas sp. A25]BBN81837.1 flavodoxin [Pseudoalteromonas sp. A25]
MVKIGIVYFSVTDVTGALVRRACKELSKQNIPFISHQIVGSEIVDGRFVNPDLMNELAGCNAIIFASPTYMGNVSAQFKAFADATSDFWERQAWAGKIAAGITAGTGLNGDQASTLQYFATLASQHGMIWLGLDAPFSDEGKNVNRLGCQLGVTAHSLDGKVHETDLRSAEYLANRVLNTAKKLASNGY